MRECRLGFVSLTNFFTRDNQGECRLAILSV